MAREITDSDGVTWSCVQAFAGLGNDRDKVKAAMVKGSDDSLRVSCTPSGGARSVTLELPLGWEEDPSGQDLLERIKSQ